LIRFYRKYLYRAVDKAGNTIDFLLRAHRDKVAAQRYFEKAIAQNGEPETVTIASERFLQGGYLVVGYNASNHDRFWI
jgi:transposase-like protein